MLVKPKKYFDRAIGGGCVSNKIFSCIVSDFSRCNENAKIDTVLIYVDVDIISIQ